MKKIILLFTFILIIAKTQAQFVTITDPNFAAWLEFTYPTCMNGNQMDTTCSAIINEDIVTIPHLNISSIEGIKYFTNLQQLDCSDNNIASITQLPVSLQKLWCFENNLTSIQSLPFSLVELDCSDNELTSLPVLPNTLDVLDCYNNNITTLPVFPTLLRVLHCGLNSMTTLPTLPQALEDLGCESLNLQSLPTLPSTLKILSCQYNQLTSLPILPNPLLKLEAFENQISSLPNLPSTLEELHVGNNNLNTIPTLPSTITYLNCQSNAINSLPIFPNGLKYFYGRYNLMISMPQIPNSVRVFDCSYNPIKCLDFAANWNYTEPAFFYFDNTEVICRPTYALNLEPTSLSAYMSYPMCTSNNALGCGVLSVDEFATINVNIFPNPASDFIQIESTTPLENIKLFDMSGRKVLETNTNFSIANLDVSQLGNGIYTLSIGNYNTKVIKQ